ncbi:histidine kinase [Streptomyces sp. NPDC050743]|uniref:histidine kinase n=1 Tax=Streptomyces sp. NPDC050743 TaxID=3365634 RepID=UPI0037B01574
MDGTENIVVFRFTEQAAAYQALSELKQLGGSTAEVTGAMLVERRLDGTVRIPEGVDARAGEGTLVGGLVGSVVGLLGGPLGVVLGWGAGALMGGGADWRRAVDSSGLVALVADEVSAGSTVLVAEVAERDTATIDLLAMRFGAVLERRPAERVHAEVKAVREAQQAAEREAAKVRREQKKARLEGTMEARGKALKQRLQRPAA